MLTPSTSLILKHVVGSASGAQRNDWQSRSSSSTRGSVRSLALRGRAARAVCARTQQSMLTLAVRPAHARGQARPEAAGRARRAAANHKGLPGALRAGEGGQERRQRAAAQPGGLRRLLVRLQDGGARDGKQRQWFVFDHVLVLPEYLVELEYVLKHHAPEREPSPAQLLELGGGLGAPMQSESEAIDLSNLTRPLLRFVRQCKLASTADPWRATTVPPPVSCAGCLSAIGSAEAGWPPVMACLSVVRG